MKELTFDIDNFNRPKTYDGAKGQSILLYHSLAGRRNDTHVTDELAFAIRRFRFDNITDITSKLRNELETHCEKYLPGIYIQDLTVTKRTKTSILLSVTILDKVKNAQGVIVYTVEKTPTEVLVNILSTNL